MPHKSKLTTEPRHEDIRNACQCLVLGLLLGGAFIGGGATVLTILITVCLGAHLGAALLPIFCLPLICAAIGLLIGMIIFGCVELSYYVSSQSKHDDYLKTYRTSPLSNLQPKATIGTEPSPTSHSQHPLHDKANNNSDTRNTLNLGFMCMPNVLLNTK